MLDIPNKTNGNMKQEIKFTLNRKPISLSVEEDRPLLTVIRTDLVLTGTKYGCGLGHCGACTVLINKEPVRSCMVTADFVNGKDVVTVEGLAQDGPLHPVQQAFVDKDALQCGYCTPGMIMNACGLLFENPEPSRSDIIDRMEENFCRCGAYNRIIEAIQLAAKKMKGGMQL
jgi:carbon-monoxide dehydrogenase small subunit